MIIVTGEICMIIVTGEMIIVTGEIFMIIVTGESL